MNVNHYTYRVTWSAEADEYLGLCVEFLSLSWLATTPEAALKGIRQVAAEVVADMKANAEPVPVPLSEKKLQRRIQGAYPFTVASAVGATSGGAGRQSESSGQREAGGITSW